MRRPGLDDQANLDPIPALDLIGDIDQSARQLDDVDRLAVAARQFGVEPGGVGNIGNQPVEPAHVVLDDLEQSPARLVGPGDRQGLDRAAQRGQRIFQFMGDVGGEALDRLHAVEQGAGHVAQRPGQMADLVVAVGEIGNFLARPDAAPHPVGGLCEPRGSARRWFRRERRRAGTSPPPPPERCGSGRAARRRWRRRCRCPGSKAASAPRTVRKRWIGSATVTTVSPRGVDAHEGLLMAFERRGHFGIERGRWRRRCPCKAAGAPD